MPGSAGVKAPAGVFIPIKKGQIMSTGKSIWEQCVRWRAAWSLVGIGLMAGAGCQNKPPEPKSETSVTTKTDPGVPGGTTVATHTVTANITAIDKENRLLTLALPEGKVQTIRCGREIVNFDQLSVGEQVKAVVTKELAVAMADSNTTPQVGGSTSVALAPKGGSPGGVLAETRMVTAPVPDIDPQNRHATLKFP